MANPWRRQGSTVGLLGHKARELSNKWPPSPFEILLGTGGSWMSPFPSVVLSFLMCKTEWSCRW